MTKSSQENNEKFEAINKLLDDEYLMAHINTSDKDVVIPEHLKKGPSVTLKLSRLFRGGIEIAPDKIQTNLLFGSNYFACTIPLVAIWAVTDTKGRNTVWPSSTPEGVLSMANDEKIVEPTATEKEKPKRPQLRRVK